MAKIDSTTLDLLIIDDEADIRKMVQSLARRMVHVESTMSVGDANEARMVLKNRLVKCVLCDNNLPMEDGVSLLKELAVSHPETGRVLLTGGPETPVLDEALEEGWVHHLFFKPVKSKILTEAIDRLVHLSKV